MSKPYLLHLKTHENLITSKEEVKAGFIAFALEKNKRCNPFINEAKILKYKVRTEVNQVDDLLKIVEIRNALLTASGISNKALNYFDENDKIKAIQGLIDDFLKPAGNNFVDELIYRFLLIKGDSLGGTMCNLTGVLAETKFKDFLVSSLKINNLNFTWYHRPSKTWLESSQLNENDVEQVGGFHWKNTNQGRSILFNRKIKFIDNKNFDICLLSAEEDQINQAINQPNALLAIGELKGGIDPAGADEHWKTANSSFKRIQKGFKSQSENILTFFIGAAIEYSMSKEIWELLETKQLSNVANLTKDDQLASLIDWLLHL